MKILMTFVLFFCGVSLAKSRIGEWAAYDYEETTTTTSVKGTLLKEIIAEKKMTSPNGKVENYILVSEKFLLGAESKELSNWILEKESLNAFDLNLYVFKCRFSNVLGEIETVKVKAGQFTSCRTKDQDHWVGIVPFHLVLSISNDGHIFKRLELVNFSWKKKPVKK